MGLKALCGDLSDCHIQLQLDNTTAVCYINNMGGTHSKLCNSIARELIIWSKERGIWVSATHVAGALNSADVYQEILMMILSGNSLNVFFPKYAKGLAPQT